MIGPESEPETISLEQLAAQADDDYTFGDTEDDDE